MSSFKYGSELLGETPNTERLSDSYQQLTVKPKRKKSRKERRMETKVLLNFCDECGADLPDDFGKYCDKCGRKLV